MSEKISTTGELRRFLAETMTGVRDGKIAIDKASQITKLAAQVNESLYAEVKIAIVRKSNGIQTDKFGSLCIDESGSTP